MGRQQGDPSAAPILILPDTADIVATAFVAPLGAVFVIAVYTVVAAVVSTLTNPHTHLTISTPIAVFGAFGMSVLLVSMFAMPIGWVMTFALGLPTVLLWCRLRGGMSGAAAATIGAALGALPILLFGGRLDGLALFSACGAATSLVFWWIALRTAA